MGKKVKKGKSVATVESGKWVGPVKTPLTGEIMACNDAVESDATILNKSPYKQGWIVRIKPSDLDGEQGELVSGDEASSPETSSPCSPSRSEGLILTIHPCL